MWRTSMKILSRTIWESVFRSLNISAGDIITLNVNDTCSAHIPILVHKWPRSEPNVTEAWLSQCIDRKRLEIKEGREFKELQRSIELKAKHSLIRRYPL